MKDIVWLTPDGTEMTAEEWNNASARCLGVYFSGEALRGTDGRGGRVTDDNFLLLFNAHHETVPFKLPGFAGADRWLVHLDTSYADGLAANGTLEKGAEYALQGRSLALLGQTRPREAAVETAGPVA